MNIIEELYYGNINPHSKRITSTERYVKATNVVSTQTELLKEKLSEHEQDILERLIEADDEIISEVGISKFKLGFSLGVQIMVDCFAMKMKYNPLGRIARKRAKNDIAYINADEATNKNPNFVMKFGFL